MLQADQLMGQPGDRVALAAAGGVLDEVAFSRTIFRGIGEQVPHHVELVISGPDLGFLPAAGLVILRLDHLGVVLQDVRQAFAGQHLAPQVVGLDSVGVGRVAGPVVPAEIERQEPRCLAFQVCAEAHLVVVHREMGHTAAELEQLLAWVAVSLVLFDGVIDGLFGQTVLQFEREHRQAVDEQCDVQ